MKELIKAITFILLGVIFCYLGIRDERLVSVAIQGADIKLHSYSDRQDRGLSKSSGDVTSSQVLSSLFEDIGEDNYGELIRQAMELDDERYGGALSSVLLSNWAKVDPLAALHYAATIKDGNHFEMLSHVLKEQGVAHFRGAVELIETEFSVAECDYLVAEIYSGVAMEDPVFAMSLVDHLALGIRRDNALNEVVMQWAEQDIFGVFDWIEEQPLNEGLYDLYSSVMMNYIERDGESSGGIIEEMFPGPLKAQLAELYASKLAKTEPESAMAWAMALGDERSRQKSVVSVYNTLAIDDPKAALNFAFDFKDEKIQPELFRQVVPILAEVDPVYLSQNFQNFPEELQRSTGEALASSWFASDSEQAFLWLQGLPEQEELYGDVMMLAVNAKATSDPAAAFQMALTPSDESKRVQFVRRLIVDWSRIDPASAEQAILQTTRLGDHQKSQLIESLYSAKVVDMLLPESRGGGEGLISKVRLSPEYEPSRIHNTYF